MPATPSIHITHLAIRNSDAAPQLEWLARLMMVGVESGAVFSSEIIPPTFPSTSDWSLVQHFQSPAKRDAWLASLSRKELLAEIAPAVTAGSVTLDESESLTHATTGSVAVAIVTSVKAGNEKAYLECESKYQTAQARREGYRGAFVQPPTDATTGSWTSMIRFDSPETLDDWMRSTERKELLAQSDLIVSSTDYQHLGTSFPGFFPQKPAGAKSPPNWKVAMLILLGLYPIVMLEIRYLLPRLVFMNPALACFVSNIISVFLTTWLTMPASINAFNRWLFPRQGAPKWLAPLCIAILVIAYSLEILFFWLT